MGADFQHLERAVRENISSFGVGSEHDAEPHGALEAEGDELCVVWSPWHFTTDLIFAESTFQWDSFRFRFGGCRGGRRGLFKFYPLGGEKGDTAFGFYGNVDF